MAALVSWNSQQEANGEFRKVQIQKVQGTSIEKGLPVRAAAETLLSSRSSCLDWQNQEQNTSRAHFVGSPPVNRSWTPHRKPSSCFFRLFVASTCINVAVFVPKQQYIPVDSGYLRETGGKCSNQYSVKNLKVYVTWASDEWGRSFPWNDQMHGLRLFTLRSWTPGLIWRHIKSFRES